jgi:hypothetical protein
MVWIFVVAIGLAALTVPALADETAAGAAASTCHECEWLKVQIGDIDDKIDSWKRQISSIQKYSDLSNPGIQNALKDINSRIAALTAKRTELQAKAADCEKRCSEARKAAPGPAVPVTPIAPGSAEQGSASGDSYTAADTYPPRAKAAKFPPPVIICPPNSPKENSLSMPRSEGVQPPALPQSMPAPPPPRDATDREEWDNLLSDMQFAELAGDFEELWIVAAEIDDAIEAARDDIAFDPEDNDAYERLEWLEVQADYYDDWKAYVRVKYPIFHDLRVIKECFVDREWLRREYEKVRQIREPVQTVPSEVAPTHSSNPHKHKHPCREDEACAMEGVAVKSHEMSGQTSAPVSNGSTVVVPSDNGDEGNHEGRQPEHPTGPDYPLQPNVPLPSDTGPHE